MSAKKAEFPDARLRQWLEMLVGKLSHGITLLKSCEMWST